MYSPGQFSRLDNEFAIGILWVWIFYFLLLWCQRILFSSLHHESLWSFPFPPYGYEVCFSDPVPGSLSFPHESGRGELRAQAIGKLLTREIFKAQFYHKWMWILFEAQPELGNWTVVQSALCWLCSESHLYLNSRDEEIFLPKPRNAASWEIQRCNCYLGSSSRL